MLECVKFLIQIEYLIVERSYVRYIFSTFLCFTKIQKFLTRNTYQQVGLTNSGTSLNSRSI